MEQIGSTCEMDQNSMDSNESMDHNDSPIDINRTANSITTTNNSSVKKQQKNHNQLTIKEKMEVLELMSSSVNRTVIAKKFNIAYSTLYKINSNRESIIKAASKKLDVNVKKINNTFQDKNRGKTYITDVKAIPNQLEPTLLLILNKCIEHNIPVTRYIFKRVALNLAEKLKISSFQCSKVWIDKIVKKFDIEFSVDASTETDSYTAISSILQEIDKCSEDQSKIEIKSNDNNTEASSASQQLVLTSYYSNDQLLDDLDVKEEICGGNIQFFNGFIEGQMPGDNNLDMKEEICEANVQFLSIPNESQVSSDNSNVTGLIIENNTKICDVLTIPGVSQEFDSGSKVINKLSKSKYLSYPAALDNVRELIQFAKTCEPDIADDLYKIRDVISNRLNQLKVMYPKLCN